MPGGGTWFSANLEALQVESSAHFDHLIFTEWGWRITDKSEVLKMITPVASLQMKSSYHFDKLILIRLKSSSQSGNLIRQELQIKLRKAWPDFRWQPKFPLWGFGSERLRVTVFWHFPEWEVPLYLIKASVDKELDKVCQVPKREVCAAVLRWR